MGTSVVFTSGKGGTGKTTAVSAIASCLAGAGRKTLCIDMDLRLRNLDLLLGLSDLAVTDLGDVVAGRCTLEEAVVAHPDIPGLSLLAAPAGPEENLDLDHLAPVVEEAKAVYDFCLIDAPAGLDSLFHLSARLADSAVILATSDATSLRDAQKAVMELDEMGFEDIRLLVNRMRKRLLKKTKSNVDDMIDIIGVPLLGIVPEDEDVLLAAGNMRPLSLCSNGDALRAFKRIAFRLRGEPVPLYYK